MRFFPPWRPDCVKPRMREPTDFARDKHALAEAWRHQGMPARAHTD